MHRFSFPSLLISVLVFGTPSSAVLVNTNGQAIPGTENFSLAPGVDLSGRNLFGLAAIEQDLTGASFADANLTAAEFKDSDIAKVNFTDATINSARFDNLSVDQLYSTANYKAGSLRAVRLFKPIVEPGRTIDFSNQDLENAEFFGFEGEFRGANFSNTKLARTNLSGDFLNASWTGANFRYVRLNGDFPSADFRNKDFRGAELQGTFASTDFSDSDLSSATLRGQFPDAIFDNARIDGVLLQNGSITADQLYSTTNYKNGDLRDIVFDDSTSFFFRSQPFDVSTWDLSGQDLSNVIFEVGDLTDTNFQNAILRRTFLTGSAIRGTNFQGADLSFAKLGDERRFNGFFKTPDFVIADAKFNGGQLLFTDLFEEEISSSTFANASLVGADFRNTTLSGVDLRGAKLQNASLERATLSNVTFDETTEFNQWTVFPDGFDPIANGLTRIESIAGDFDASGEHDAADITVFSERLGQQRPPEWLDGAFDLNADASVNQADMNLLLELANATPGDTNLDGQINFIDFLKLSDSYQRQGGWEEGDFDGSGVVNFSDFLALSDNFGRTTAQSVSVPEPSGWALPSTLIGIVYLSIRRRRRPRCQSSHNTSDSKELEYASE